MHIIKRIQSAYAATANLKTQGLYKEELGQEVKATMLQAYVRPRLTYTCEALFLKNDELEKIIRTEGNILKKALNLSKSSYSTELYCALQLMPLREFIIKRKLSFAKQLVENPFTLQLIKRDSEVRKETLSMTNIENQHELVDNTREFKELIDKEIKRIHDKIDAYQNNALVKVIKYLMLNPNKCDNKNAIINHITMSKNNMRDYVNDCNETID